MTWKPRWLVEQRMNPAHVRREVNAVLHARKPVEMTAWLTRHHQVLRMNITLRTLRTEMREGEPDTLYYTLSFREWRHPDTRRRGRLGVDKLPTTHYLDGNDSLYSLSKLYYHTHAGWDDIARANHIRHFGKKTPLVKHRRFKVGSKIKIPLPSFPLGAGQTEQRPTSGPRIR
jgi:hypothetical protein